MSERPLSTSPGSAVLERVRRSPVIFDAVPATIERRRDWDVVLEFEDDAAAPDPSAVTRLVDLSHRTRWDYQDRRIDDRRPFGLAVPASPGGVAVKDGLMVNRMNRTQASIWHVGPDALPATPDDIGVTETTDSHCWLAVLGDGARAVLECVTSLDLFPPARSGPFLTQGPVLHVPCQVVTWRHDCVLIALSRGYGQTFVDAMLHAAGGVGLAPGGERRFTDWVAGLGGEAA